MNLEELKRLLEKATPLNKLDETTYCMADAECDHALRIVAPALIEELEAYRAYVDAQEVVPYSGADVAKARSRVEAIRVKRREK